MLNPTQFNQGDIVAHYKSFYNNEEDFINKKYFYQILYPEAYTTDDEPIKCVVYQALYGDKKVWIRRYDEFMSDIYVPGIPFKYRFTSIYDIPEICECDNIRKMFESINSENTTRKWTSSMIDNLENRNNRVYSPEVIERAAEEYIKRRSNINGYR